MSKVLFVPLNTNHVLIFSSIMQSLTCDYMAVCHDRISEASQYQTESVLKAKGIRHVHFPEKLTRSVKDNIPTKIRSFLKIRKRVRALLDQNLPGAIVLAIDNDPITQVFIEEAVKRGIRVVLVQEALIRPHELVERKAYLSDYFYRFLRSLGVYLTYTRYASSPFDMMLVGGRRAFDIMRQTGIPEEKLAIIGQPKYDAVMDMIKGCRPPDNKRKIYLFAASTTVVHDDKNIRFLKKVLEAAQKLGIYVIIKLHPRASIEPSDVHDIVGSSDAAHFEVIKKGDDTFELLKKADGLITVSSTVVLEALMLDKECIVADYLAGESCLRYDEYDAVHSIRDETEIFDRIRDSLFIRKSRQNKQRLLNDELYKLDGKSGDRAATSIEKMVAMS